MTTTPSVDGRAALDRELGRTQRQLAALDRWHQARRAAERAAQVREVSREQRMDLARRLDVIRAEHAAIVGRSDAALRASAEVAGRADRPSVVLAHRSPWTLDRLTAGLADLGVDVVGRVSDGAEAVGAAVTEQPDLVLVESVLPRLSGLDVIREVRAYCPSTLVAAQVDSDEAVGAALDAGARAAYARKVPPAELAQALHHLVTSAA